MMTFEEMQKVLEGILEAQAGIQRDQTGIQRNQAEIQHNQAGIQRDIQGLLSVQRALQESNIKLRQSLDELAHQARITERNLNRRLGYNIDQETELSVVRDEVEILKTRVDALKQNQ
jgi:uncharacterized protein YoxC